ncbi:MAG: hypothetical protein RLZZ342_739 [Candidatus Parcubacteria bacterium]|jgi:hypothetical protein
MSRDEEETWYQAIILLKHSDRKQNRSDNLLLGPPRRLLEDIKLDIARGRSRAAERLRSSSFWKLGETGALVLWPPERRGEWMPIECKVPAEV